MRYWINTVSRSHVQEGIAGGFIQEDPGREARLRKLAKGDRVVFYSPRAERLAGEVVQRFTAIAEVIDDEPHQAGEVWRRHVRYVETNESPVQPLIDSLGFISNKKTWGVTFRRGFFEIGEADFRTIEGAMAMAAVA